jgi:hypothetical protein
MDDRFDRRELLLHLGDVLEASSCLARIGRPEAPVRQLATEHDSLQSFEFLRAVSPKMTAAEFGARAASAFFLWPKELLDLELNQNALASTVQHDLFAGNPEGWKAYVAHMQEKVKWFGTGLPRMRGGASTEPTLDVAKDVGQVGASVKAAQISEWDASDEKRGWPWPEPGSTS